MNPSHFTPIRLAVLVLVVALASACARGVSDAGANSFTDDSLSPDAALLAVGDDPHGEGDPGDASTGRPPRILDSSASEDGAAILDGRLGNLSSIDRGDGASASLGGGIGTGPEDGSEDGLSPPGDASDGDAIDASAAESPPWLSTAFPGDLIITEVMFAPWGKEPESEWFEVYNANDQPKLLSGLTIEDGYPRTHVIAASPPVIAPAHAYVVLVRDRATAEANMIPGGCIVYEYGAGLAPGEGIELENGVTGAVSLWNGETELADVPYGPWDMASFGDSIELAALQSVGSDTQANWCLAQYPWVAGSDEGTPGTDNDCP